MSKTEERFDIYDNEFKFAGTATRSEVHAKGLWHRTFQCWIVNEQDGETTLLYQRRHPEKDTYPGLLDISCAGHLIAGETIEEGHRELEEELGVVVSFAELEPCGVFLEEKRLEGGILDREMCHVFVYRSNQPLDKYKLQEDEVTGLYRVAMEDVKRLAQPALGPIQIAAAGVEVDEQGNVQKTERMFNVENFVPRSPEYYEMMLKIAEKR